MNISAATKDLERVFGVALEATALASILIILVAGVQWVAGKRLGPSWRFALWGIVLVRLLLPIAPESRFSLFNAAHWVVAVGAEPKVVSEAGFTLLVEPKTALFPEISEKVERQTVATKKPRIELSWRAVLAAIWLAGSLWFLSRLAIGFLWLGWRLRKEGNVSELSNEVADTVERAAADLKTRVRFRLIESETVSSPALFGLLRPRLLVPPGFAQKLTPSELRHVFLHELAHLKRRDLLTNWLSMVALAVHWFNPLVWLAFRQMRIERELACDEMVLRATSGEDESRAYGETILRLLEGVTNRRNLPALVGIAEEKHSARKRILQIVAFDRTQRSLRLLGMTMLIVVGVGGLTNAQIKRIETAREGAKTVAEGEATPVKQAGPTDEKENFENRDQRVVDQLIKTRFPNVSLEGKTVAEAIELVEKSLPEALRELRFRWRQTTNMTSPPGGAVFSVNAVGYIDMPIDESPAMELKLLRLHLTNSPVGRVGAETLELANQDAMSVLELITRSTAKELGLEISGGNVVTFYEKKRPGQDPELRQATGILVNDARLLIEMGKYDEAENRLKQAMRLDPEHGAAFNYLKLAQELRLRRENPSPTNRIYTSKGRQVIVRKLNETMIDHYEIPKPLKLNEVIKDIHAITQRNDPDKVGVNFIVNSYAENPGLAPGGVGAPLDPNSGQPPVKVGEYEVTISPPMKNIRMTDLLETIVRVAVPPRGAEPGGGLQYAIEEYAVVISQRSIESEPLYTKTFKLDPKTFVQGMEGFSLTQNPFQRFEGVAGTGGQTSGQTAGGGIIGITPINSMSSVQDAVRNFFVAAGLDFQPNQQAFAQAGAGGQALPPPKAIFFNDRTGVLMVRATLRDLDLVEKALQTLNVAPQKTPKQ